MMESCWIKIFIVITIPCCMLMVNGSLFIPPEYKKFNFYEVLKVTTNARTTELKKQYSKLTKQTNSRDISKKQKEDKLLKFAFDLLSDKKKRQEYNEYLASIADGHTAEQGAESTNTTLAEQWQECQKKCKDGTCEDRETFIECVCDENKYVDGVWCDESVIISKQCKRQCRAPNKCVHVDQVDSMITSVLRKHEKIYGNAYINNRYKKNIKEAATGQMVAPSHQELCFCRSLGYHGKKCKKRCKPGYFGLYCMARCDLECTKPCNVDDGECKCRRGFASGNITSTCVPVEATEENCEELCKLGKCDGPKCICNYAQEPYCDIECSKVKPHPKYGKTCENTCGGCTRLPCDKDTGVCPKPKIPGRSRCLTKDFVGKKCELGAGVNINSTMLLKIKKQKSALGILKRKVLPVIALAVPLFVVSTSIGIGLAPLLPVGLTAALVDVVVVLCVLLGKYVYKKYNTKGKRQLLQITETDQFELDISLPMPAGANSSVYKDFMQQVLEKVADDFEADPSSGISVDRDSIQVTGVQPFEVDLPNSEVNTMPVVIGGIILAAGAVLSAIIALVIVKRKKRTTETQRRALQQAHYWRGATALRVQATQMSNPSGQYSAQQMKQYSQTVVY